MPSIYVDWCLPDHCMGYARYESTCFGTSALHKDGWKWCQMRMGSKRSWIVIWGQSLTAIRLPLSMKKCNVFWLPYWNLLGASRSRRWLQLITCLRCWTCWTDVRQINTYQDCLPRLPEALLSLAINPCWLQWKLETKESWRISWLRTEGWRKAAAWWTAWDVKDVCTFHRFQ